MRSLPRLLRQVSLRSKLVALMATLMMCGVLVTALSASASLRLTLQDQMDTDLKDNSIALANIMWSSWKNQEMPSEGATLEFNRFRGTLRDNDGNVRYELPHRKHTDAPEVPPMTVDEVRDLKSFNMDVPGTEESSRGWRTGIYTLRNNDGYIVVSLPLQSTMGTVDKATKLVVTSGTLVTLVMSMIAYGITGRALRPLVRVERTAAAIAAGDLSRRVEEYPPETEVGRLSRSLNAMLAHIEQAFRGRAASERKMRRFIQDASHELRTPLVTIQGYSELYRHGGVSGEEQIGTAMGRIEGEAKRMAQLVEDLLTLARLDEQRPLERQPVDLLQLGSDAVEDARVNAPMREVRLVGLDGPQATSAPSSGDELRLRQVVGNLMTNALRYTPEGSPLEVAVGVLPVIDGRSDAVLAIRDHGSGISEEDAARVFERFYRADSSRQRETGGTGLGLAIVAAIVAQHDGSVRLTETPGGGATMSIHLPLVPADSSSTDDDGS
ncbi:MAG: sensor histidine kinase [Arthrobacter sp.]|uniref:sensor histidine kinase n=1 Tax=unclassified Arthrobacter TaxID=235627 RepID=UPI003FB8FC13